MLIINHGWGSLGIHLLTWLLEQTVLSTAWCLEWKANTHQGLFQPFSCWWNSLFSASNADKSIYVTNICHIINIKLIHPNPNYFADLWATAPLVHSLFTQARFCLGLPLLWHLGRNLLFSSGLHSCCATLWRPGSGFDKGFSMAFRWPGKI